jgi:hypothetical protein
MLFNRNKIQIDVYINYSNDIIRHRRLIAEPGINALDALDRAANIEYTPDESATGHHGAMVTSVDGFKIGIDHFWIYYVFEKNQTGWRIPQCTPDLLRITEDARIAWRYHSAINGKDLQRYGPLFTSDCISKIKRCNRQF